MNASMENNICGSCTICCELTEIAEIKKPANTLCGNCTLGKGCNIYESRPKSCRDFNCLYIQSNMDIGLRPDNCNVMFEKITTKIYLALNHYEDVKAWEQKKVFDYIKILNSKGISVITSSFTREPKRIFLAKEHTKEGVIKVVSNILYE